MKKELKNKIKKAQEQNRYGTVAVENPDGTVEVFVDEKKADKAHLEDEKLGYSVMEYMMNAGLCKKDDKFLKKWKSDIDKLERSQK